MNLIPAFEMKDRRTSASDCIGNQMGVKYEFVSSETFGAVSDLLLFISGQNRYIKSKLLESRVMNARCHVKC